MKMSVTRATLAQPGRIEVRDARGQRLAWIQVNESEFAVLNTGLGRRAVEMR